jgi:YfiH family protein
MTANGFQPEWRAPAWVRAWQSVRTGGVSTGPYSSLNLGLHVGDDEPHVMENRRRLVASRRMPAEPCWLDQVHGARILDLDRARGGRADGAVTGSPGIVCAVMTADCLPVLFATKHERRVGAAHAGWRGLVAGVLPAAVAALGGDPADIVAWLGPAISQPAYEVGDEVRAAFLAVDERAAAAFVPSPAGRWLADLYALARASLESAGVGAIAGGGLCTQRDGRFFSHRREAPCGRMASLIWIADDDIRGDRGH